MSTSESARIIAKNLKNIAFMREKSQSDIARALNINKQTVSSWMTGKSIPRMDKVELLCKYFNVTKSDILEDKPLTYRKEQTQIPVLGRVAAGQPLLAVTDILGYEDMTREKMRSADYYALEIRGDSMEPRMWTGDRVIFRAQEDAESGDIVIAMVNGDDATCKKLRKYPHGIDLIPLNPKYEPMYFSNEEIISKPVKIIGKVVELRARF